MSSLSNHWYMSSIKKIKFLMLVLLFSAEVLGQTTQTKNMGTDDVYRIIFSLNIFHSAKPQEAEAVAQVLANHLKESEKFSLDVDIIIAVDREDILKKIQGGFDIIILSSQEYYELKNKIQIEPVFVNLTFGYPGYKYFLLVNKADGINDIKQLNGESILIQAREGQDSPRLWLDYLLEEKKLPEKRKFFKDIKYDNRINNVVLPVFFKKAKVSLVTEAGYRLVSDLNPQVGKDLKILYESNYIPFGVGCTNASKYDQERKKKVLDVLFDLHNNSYGKQILDLFATEKLTPFKAEYMLEYLKLKK